MRVLILGVGDAFTTKGFGTSALIRNEPDRAGRPPRYLLVDCPDLIHRALAEGCHHSGWKVDAHDIDDIIITHLHGDHCNGLESFAFSRLVARLQEKEKTLPRVHTHPEAAARLWERLAPAMDAPIHKGGRKARLEDYIDLRVIEPGKPATIAGLTVECRYSIHPIPTIGVKIRAARGSLGWSGDTVFDPAHVEWLSDCDVIVHEANIGPAHTQVEVLNSLPEIVRKKMRITHIVDDFDPSWTDIKPLREGEVLEF